MYVYYQYATGQNTRNSSITQIIGAAAKQSDEKRKGKKKKYGRRPRRKREKCETRNKEKEGKKVFREHANAHEEQASVECTAMDSEGT